MLVHAPPTNEITNEECGQKKNMIVPIELQLEIYNFVALQFATFSNNKNKGVNFSWNNFPDLMSNWVTSIMKLSAPFDSKYDDHVKEIAKKFAKQLVLKMHEPL